jgi:nucleotide-binding universal stress UspA family protein
METIVVGVDGSECAGAALEFAAAEAALRGARLRIVSAWEVPSAIYGGGFAPLDASVFDGFRERGQAVADQAVATVVKLQPAVECEGVVLEGQPAAILLEQAADATLVVVGNRGLGGFKSLLLGSVSQQVVHHASCPVVVVRAGTETGLDA